MTPVGIVFKRRLVVFVMCHLKCLEFHPRIHPKEERCAISHQVGVEVMTRHLPEAPFRNVIYLSPYIFYPFRWGRERLKLACGTCVSRGCMSASTIRKIVISENITFFCCQKSMKTGSISWKILAVTLCQCQYILDRDIIASEPFCAILSLWALAWHDTEGSFMITETDKKCKSPSSSPGNHFHSRRAALPKNLLDSFLSYQNNTIYNH